MPGTGNNFVEVTAVDEGVDNRVFVKAVIVNGTGTMTFKDSNGDRLFALKAGAARSLVYELNGTVVDGILVESLDAGMVGYIQIQ